MLYNAINLVTLCKESASKCLTHHTPTVQEFIKDS